MARAYESASQTDEAVKALTEAADILQAHPDELPGENLAHVCDKLVSLLTSADRFEASERWALLAVQLRQDDMLQEPGVALLAEKYGAACASAGIVESRLGKFQKAEKYFQDGLKVFYDVLPLSQNCARTLEYYTSCLHQQGKTELAIAALEQYERVIAAEPGNALALCKAWRRAATLLFTIGEWSRCEALLLKAEAEVRVRGCALCGADGACRRRRRGIRRTCRACATSRRCTGRWATRPRRCTSPPPLPLRRSRRCSAKEAQLRACKVSAFQFQLLPTTRSELLSTLDCQLLQGKYKLELRVNRYACRPAAAAALTPAQDAAHAPGGRTARGPRQGAAQDRALLHRRHLREHRPQRACARPVRAALRCSRPL